MLQLFLDHDSSKYSSKQFWFR